MKEGERYILTTGKASVIRDALCLVLARVQSEGDLTPGSCESLAAFARERCDRLILDLRTVKEPPVGIDPGVRNLRASHLGQVLVVTGEVAGSEILHEIEALRRPHRFPQQLV